jgi:hypothetical protein
MKNNNYSNITKKNLLLHPEKYFWIEITDPYFNSNFLKLLKFIDSNVDYGKDHDLGNAYYCIRNRTNKLLGVGPGSPVYIKTSKREIRTIRLSVEKGLLAKKNYLRIPYKVSYIFKAIIDIVEELSQKVPIPSDLSQCISNTYKIAFYNKHISTYNTYFNSINENNLHDPGYAIKVALNDDFNSPNSVFNNKF